MITAERLNPDTLNVDTTIAGMEAAFTAEAAAVGTVAIANNVAVQQPGAIVNKYIGGKLKLEVPEGFEANNIDVVPALDLSAIAAQKERDINSKMALIKYEKTLMDQARQKENLRMITEMQVYKSKTEEDED